MKRYIQYGCGLSAPNEWENYDASPTLRIQKIPFVGKILKSKLNAIFPENVLFGDIIKGLPILENSVDGVYCSHVLEHFSYFDLKIALQNTYQILKEGGVFRCVLPDLEYHLRKYLNDLELEKEDASLTFLNATQLGVVSRPKGLKDIISQYFGNSNHLWMWDKLSLMKELEIVGFKNIRRCHFNDSDDSMFNFVEDENRFNNCLAFECIK